MGESTNAVLRWALVGTGAISRTTVRDIQATDGAELVGVASRTESNAAAFATEHAIPHWYRSYQDLFADDAVDVVYICTPISTHADLARQALMAGKHVLVEKAFTANAADARALAEVAASQSRFLMEAMWMRFNPVIGRLLSEVASGTIGEIVSVQAAFGFPPPAGGGIWRPELGGGALLDLGVYPLTLAHLLLGTPTAVEASGEVREDGLDLTAAVFLRYSEGRFATGQTTLRGFVGAGASVGGTGGFIAVDPPFHAATSYTVITPPFTSPRTVTVQQEGRGYVPMFRAVTDAISRGLLEHPDRPLRDTIAVLETIDQVRGLLTGHEQLRTDR